MEHGPRCRAVARGGQPDGRLRHHARLPRVPATEVDGRPTGSDLRRSRVSPASTVDRHHGQRSVPGPVSQVGSGHESRCLRSVRAPVPVRWPQPWNCGSGHSSICARRRTPTASRLYRDNRQGATFPMADALCWLLASYYQILDVVQLEEEAQRPRGPERRAARAASSSSPTCATCRPHERLAKSPVSARNWSSATTVIPAGNPAAANACRPTNWTNWKVSFPAFPSAFAWPATSSKSTDRTSRRPARACGSKACEVFGDRRSKIDGCLTGSRLGQGSSRSNAYADRDPGGAGLPSLSWPPPRCT